MAAPLLGRCGIFPRFAGRLLQPCTTSTGVCGRNALTHKLEFCAVQRRCFSNKLFLKSSSALATAKTSLSRATLLFISAGVGYTVWCVQQNSHSLHADTIGRPQPNPIRKVRPNSDNTGLKLTLYQYQTCPFCCKVRAFLDYHGFAYDVVEVNSVWRREVKWSKYKKVPILVIEGMGEEGFLPLHDSSVIISILQSYLEDKSQKLDTLVTYYPSLENTDSKGKSKLDWPNRYFVMYGEKQNLTSSPDERKEERKWRHWADNYMVHAISPNVYRTPKEAVQAFYNFSEIGQWEKIFNTFERYSVIYVGAAAMFLIGKMLKKKYHIKDDVRETLYEYCNDWTKALGKRRFMGGNTPNLADLAVYGVLCSMEGCGAFQDALDNTKISDWFHRTKAACSAHSGTVAAHMAVA